MPMKRPPQQRRILDLLALAFDRYFLRLFVVFLKLTLLGCAALFLGALLSGSRITSIQTGSLLRTLTLSFSGIVIGGVAFLLVDFLLWRRFEKESRLEFWDPGRKAWASRNGSWILLCLCISLLLWLLLALLKNALL